MPPRYAILAQLVLAVHLALVLFVVLGLPLVWVGNARRWQWVNAWRFRVLHLATIGVVVAHTWLSLGGGSRHDGLFRSVQKLKHFRRSPSPTGFVVASVAIFDVSQRDSILKHLP